MAKKNKVVSEIVGGMLGGAAMALGLYATSRIDLARVPIVGRFSDETDQFTFVGTSSENDKTASALGKTVLATAMLGGIYGGLRSALRLPGFLFGPIFGLATYAINWLGLGPEMKRVPGPWNSRDTAILPRMVTHAVYGFVADQVAERVENALE